jgi:hypothetical protein
MNDQLVLQHLGGPPKTVHELMALTGLSHTQIYTVLVHLESIGRATVLARISEGAGRKGPRVALWEAA